MPVINRNGHPTAWSWTTIAIHANQAGMSADQFYDRHGAARQNIPFTPPAGMFATPHHMQTATIQAQNVPTLGWGDAAIVDAQIDEMFAAPQLTTGGGVPTDNPFTGLFTQPTIRRTKKEANTSEKSTALLQELYKYKAMTLRKTDSVAYEKNNKVNDKPFEWTTLQGMVGIEVEVENIRNSVPLAAYWDTKADGSLRNNGVEYVSVPLQIKQIQLALEHLYGQMLAHNKPDFSNRTSIHIHVNCRDMTQDQIFNFCILYALFEKHFYQVAGTRRMNSIFCVPLFRTNQMATLNSVIYGYSSEWNKYCGLNLLPLFNNNVTNGYGTIEFRHLFGTEKIEDIMMWINDILCLRKFALEISKEDLVTAIKEMNTTSSYMAMYSQVFEKGRKLLSNKKDFEECVSNIKRELFGNDYLNTLRKTDASAYWQVAHQLNTRG